MATHLHQDNTLTIFPEGTTSNGLRVLPFHANLFEAAIRTNAPVQAVALGYLDDAPHRPSLAASSIGDDTLMGSIWRTLCAPALRVQVNFATPIGTAGLGQRELAQTVRQCVVNLL